MRAFNQLMFMFILLFHIGCKSDLHSDLQFVFSTDKEGVSIVSLSDNSSKSIYKTNSIFINDYFMFINDSILQIGHQSGLTSDKNETKVEYITDTIKNINIQTGANYISKIIDYEHYEHSTLSLQTKIFNEKGEIISNKDTSYACAATINSSKGLKFCSPKRFYSISETITGKTIISDRGDLIIQNKNNKKILLKHNEPFDPKFGSGFYNPTLSRDGLNTSFQYLAGFLKSGSCIYEMNLKTKSKTKLIGEGYSKPLYSPDNKLLLLFSNEREAKANTWIKTISIINIETKMIYGSETGENYLWVPKAYKDGR